MVGTRLWPMVPPGMAAILRYHRVAGHLAPLSVTAREFESQLRFLRRRCTVVSAAEIASAVAEERSLPPRAVAITFDDGYEDNVSQALPLLQRYELPATFFVTAGWIGTEHIFWWDRLHEFVHEAAREGSRPVEFAELPEPVAAVLRAAGPALRTRAGAIRLEGKLVAALRSLGAPPEELDVAVENIAAALGCGEVDTDRYRAMDWDQVRALRDAGMGIGSHSAHHARLATVPPERAYAELEESKTIIEQELEQAVTLLAYPAGDCNQDAVDLADEAGYQAAFTTESGPVRPGDDVFRLRRIGVWTGGYRGVFRRFSPSVFGLQVGRLTRQEQA